MAGRSMPTSLFLSRPGRAVRAPETLSVKTCSQPAALRESSCSSRSSIVGADAGVSQLSGQSYKRRQVTSFRDFDFRDGFIGQRSRCKALIPGAPCWDPEVSQKRIVFWDRPRLSKPDELVGGRAVPAGRSPGPAASELMGRPGRRSRPPVAARCGAELQRSKAKWLFGVQVSGC